jgi:hypothetical protein
MFECVPCGFAHSSPNALAIHLAKIDGAKRLAARYVTDEACPICLMQFATRSKAILNLSRRQASICMIHLLLVREPMTDEEVDALDFLDRQNERCNRRRGRGSTYNERPAENACGPVRPLFICVQMSRRSINIGLGIAMQRAVEVPMRCPPHLAGALGETMTHHFDELRYHARELLVEQAGVPLF